ncbi:MAG: hypothetical protein ISS15_16590 [Alphaproteobacteria bacterium]|nr:hypothetical protein [Alphaproteobacteria bacterium]MBL6937897.1 hypothetical protein [Alphaproteobacteria bacterium]MBL7099278.1 hypothetical protein [Alphaproteobacteria bacterium]
MHMHIVGAVLHGTILAVIGYALLFSATRTAGITALIGRLLGIWLFILAILGIVAAVTAPMFGGKPFGIDMGPPMHHWDLPGDHAPPPSHTPPPPSAP